MRASEYLKLKLQECVVSLGLPWSDKTGIEPPKDKKFGDLASNIALIISKEAKCAPIEIAKKIADILAHDELVVACDVAGPGFINVTFSPTFWQQVPLNILEKGDSFGAANVGEQNGQKKRVQVEFVSANPTGPLHIGHARGAALGDSLVRLLRFTQHYVESEYYINDAGRQMQTLGFSVFCRAKELVGEGVTFPEECYKGEYIIDIAREVLSKTPNLLSFEESEAINLCFEYAHKEILEGIKKDLENFGVAFDSWYSERSLLKSGEVQKALDKLNSQGFIFEEDGATWFRTMDFGDDKNRVLRKSNGELTYFTTDIAYHANKFERGFDLLVNILGADHHGYIPRMKAAIQALGKDANQFEAIILQLVNLLSSGIQVSMSTRAGQFETLADVLNEVGTDAARFMFLSRKADSPLDFDLELVKSKSMDNPVYYVQYAHARICNLFFRAEERGIKMPNFEKATWDADAATPMLSGDFFAPLVLPEELELMKFINGFTEMIETSAKALAPHHISYYLMELAKLLHGFYSSVNILGVEDKNTLLARLGLLASVKQVLKTGLGLLGVSAPETM